MMEYDKWRDWKYLRDQLEGMTGKTGHDYRDELLITELLKYIMDSVEPKRPKWLEVEEWERAFLEKAKERTNEMD